MLCKKKKKKSFSVMNSLDLSLGLEALEKCSASEFQELQE